MPRKKKLPKNVVKKKGSESWYVRRTFINNGVREEIWRRCYDESEEGVKTLLDEIKAEHNRTVLNLEAPPKTFYGLAEKFLENECVPAIYDASGKKLAGLRSLDAPERIAKFWREYFGRKDYHQISYGDLKETKLELLSTPVVSPKQKIKRQRSSRTVHYYLQILRQIFNFAIRKRWMNRSPFVDGPPLINPSDDNHRYVSWTREEEVQALALCTEEMYRAHLKTVIICITDGGFRRSEILNAKWKDVNFKEGTVIARTYKGKNLTSRSISMTERMKQNLLGWKERQIQKNLYAEDALIIGFKSIRTAWENIRAKIGRPDLDIQDLRHVFASRMSSEVKADIVEIQKLLGHSRITTTQIYVNPDLNSLANLSKGLDKAAEQFQRREKVESDLRTMVKENGELIPVNWIRKEDLEILMELQEEEKIKWEVEPPFYKISFIDNSSEAAININRKK